MKKKPDNVIKFQKQIQINIGIVVFGIIFIYVIFHIFSYLTSDNVTIYEVTQGTIASNNEYRALAIRDESIYYSDTEGMVYYYAKNSGRVGVKSLIYSIDETGAITSEITSDNSDVNDISAIDLSSMENNIQSFMNDFSDNTYQKTYSFKTDLSSTLENLYSMNAISDISEEINAATAAGTFHLYYGLAPGVVVFATDGFEDVTLDNYSADSFDSSKLDYTNLKGQDKVLSGQAVYKLINSEKWNLVLQIDEDTATDFAETNYVEISFKEDNVSTWAACAVQQKAGDYYLVLSLDDSMERYATSRFINIELLLDEQTGLKIPNSAIIEKEFYTIPKGYFYQGDDSGSVGVMVDAGDNSSEFITPTIYYETDEYYYVDNEELHKGDSLIKADSQESYKVGSETDKLSGVYNVNKGYAVFKQIDPLYQTDDYTIVKTGTDYGIALYDHIVLQGDLVEENDIIN